MALRRHRLLLIVVAFALVGATAAAGCSKSSKSASSTSTAKATTTTAAKSVNAGAVIAINEFSFTPATVTIKAGQTVEWKNDGNVAHTVTETTTPRTFGSADINPGQSFTQTFATPGTYNYVCSIHPDRMQGSIVVTAAG